MPAPTQGQFEIVMQFRDQATGQIKSAVRTQVISIQDAAKRMTGNFNEIRTGSGKMANAYSEHGRKMRLTTTDLQLALGRLRNQLLLLTFAYQSIKRIVLPVIKAAEDQEHAERRLEIAFRMRKNATDEQIESMKRYASALQIMTVYGDEEIMNVMSLLANFRLTTRQIREATPVILDVARSYSDLTGESLDLEGVTRGLGRALSGEGLRALQQLGIHIPKTVKDSKDFKSILEAIKRVAGDSAKSMGTLSDEIKKFKNNIGDISEEIGLKVLPKMRGFLSYINVLIERRRALDQLEEKKTGKKAPSFFESFLQDLPKINEAVENILKDYDRLSKAGEMPAGTTAAGYLFERLRALREETRAATIELEKLIITPKDKIEELKSTWQNFIDWLNISTPKIEKMWEDVGDAFEKAFSDVLFDAIVGEFKTFDDYVRAFGREVIRIFTDIIAQIIRAKIVAMAVGTVAHTGGIVSKGGRHERFDTGGRASNEVNAVLQTGEGVLSRRGMRALSALNRGENAGGGSTFIYINAIDVASFRERLMQNTDIFEGSSLSAVARGGKYRRQLREVLG